MKEKEMPVSQIKARHYFTATLASCRVSSISLALSITTSISSLVVWGWWQQDRYHYLNTKKCREEALAPEHCCVNTQTKYPETHGPPRVCTSAFTYSFKQVLIESPLSMDSWNCLLISLAEASFQSILSSAFRMILLKSISLSFSPDLLGPLQLKSSMPYSGPIPGPQSTLCPTFSLSSLASLHPKDLFPISQTPAELPSQGLCTCPSLYF